MQHISAGNDSDIPYEIAADSNGNIIVTGITNSTNFPTSTNAFDQTLNGSWDYFVTKFDNTLSMLISSTYIGGSSNEVMRNNCLVVDNQDNIIITGVTESSNFPVTPGVLDSSYNGGKDACIVKFDNNLTNVIASTFLGGSGWDDPHVVTLHDDGSFYIGGWAWGGVFPTTPNAYSQSMKGPRDAFICKISDSFDVIMNSTYFGGTSYDNLWDIKFDNAGNLYFCGASQVNSPVTSNSFDTTYNGGYCDGFVGIMKEDLSELIACSYLGGGETDFPIRLNLHANKLYVLGGTSSPDMYFFEDAYDNTLNGGYDYFFASIDLQLDIINNFTYLGGTDAESYDGGSCFGSLKFNSNNQAVVFGYTLSSDFPVTDNAYDKNFGDEKNLFISILGDQNSSVDSDQDGVSDDIDNCPDTSNPDQRDLDNDGIGNLCDDDVDGDGLTNEADDDDDNDGFTDTEENEGGSDPYDPTSLPNQPPSIPVQLFPQDEATCFEPLLKWEASTDPDNDSFHYALSVSEVLADNSLNEIFSGNVNSDETSFPLGIIKDEDEDEGILESGKSYAWTIKAIDQHGNESESGPSYFNFGWKAVNGSWDDSINGTFIPFASDPVNPDNLYIGCYELTPGETGIYKSEDRGITWTARKNGIDQLGVFTKKYPPIYTISVSQHNPEIVFFGTAVTPDHGYVYRSIDGGNSWENASGEKSLFGVPTIHSAVVDIAIDQTSSDVVYAGVINQGVFKTTNGGMTWDKIYGGSPPTGVNNCYNLVEIHPTNNQEIFINGFTYNSISMLPNFLKPFSEWNGSNSVPNATGTVPMRMMRSFNGGQDWDYAWPVDDGVDYDSDRWALITDLILDPTDNATYFSMIGYKNPLFYNSPNRGILKSIDDGNSWENVNSCCALDLSDYPIYRLIQSENPKRLIASSAKNIFISENNGETWAKLPAASTAFTSNIGLAGNRLFALTGEGIFYIDLPSETLSFIDSDCDALSDYTEESGCTDINIADTDQDGLADGEEDINNNGTVDPGETDPCDADTDDDGVNDKEDKCPVTANPDQSDLDNDGIGDLCDDDMDGDGFTNTDEESANSDPENPDSIPDRPPSAPKLLFPTHNQTNVSIYVNFKWESSIDPDGDTIEYCVTLMEDSEPNDIEIIKGCDDGIFRQGNWFVMTELLEPGKKYWWAVWARDSHGNWSESSEWLSFTTVERIPQIYGLFVGIQDPIRAFKGGDCAEKARNYFASAFLNADIDNLVLKTANRLNGYHKSQFEIDLNESMSKLNDGDIFVLYIAAHGGTVTENDNHKGEYEINPGDEFVVFGSDQLLGAGKVEDENFILYDDDLARLLKQHNDIEKWIIIEACHSGGFLGVEGFPETDGFDLIEVDNISFLASTAEDNVGTFSPFTGQGHFNMALVEALSYDSGDLYVNADSNEDGELHFNEIVIYIKNWFGEKTLSNWLNGHDKTVFGLTEIFYEDQFVEWTYEEWLDNYNPQSYSNSSLETSLYSYPKITVDAGGPYSGKPGAPVSIEASSESTGDIVEYNWDWDNDGIYDETTLQPSTLHIWGSEYSGFIGVKATDSEGFFAEDTAAVEIKYPDSDGDGISDDQDRCPNDPNKTSPGACGCGSSDRDSDKDGVADCNDDCPNDPAKTKPGSCGCGETDTDSDNDGTADCSDACPDYPEKIDSGVCGCGILDTDTDNDGTPDCIDNCPNDPNKTDPGVCGCGKADTDSDNDGALDCNDNCPNDASKTEPGNCGCGITDTDSDNDGTADCIDECPNDPNKIEPGDCGCGEADTDTDNDGTSDCIDNCPNDPDKTEPGACGCGTADTDSDSDGTSDCNDNCPNDPNKTDPGVCGCGVEDIDNDSDGTLDCNDNCPNDPDKIEPGACGCGVADTDSDGDGIADCNEKSDSDDSCFISSLL